VSVWIIISELYFWKESVLLTAEGNIVEMGRCLDSLNFAADIEIFDPIAEICNRRMSRIISTKDLNGLLHSVRSVNIFDCIAVRKV